MRRLPARAFTAFLPLPNLIFLRGARGLKFPGDFMRLNPHMHNKSFTVDNQASVVGGFNIANAVFGAGISLGLVNLDRFVVDPVMREDGLF